MAKQSSLTDNKFYAAFCKGNAEEAKKWFDSSDVNNCKNDTGEPLILQMLRVYYNVSRAHLKDEKNQEKAKKAANLKEILVYALDHGANVNVMTKVSPTNEITLCSHVMSWPGGDPVTALIRPYVKDVAPNITTTSDKNSAESKSTPNDAHTQTSVNTSFKGSLTQAQKRSFICPISGKIMTNVVSVNGVNFDKKSIEQLKKEGKPDPVTGLEIQEVTSNHTLTEVIKRLRKAHEQNIGQGSQRQ